MRAAPSVLKRSSRPRSPRSEARHRCMLLLLLQSPTDSTAQPRQPVITEEKPCGDIMAPVTESCVLKIKEGKFVTVRKFKDGLKLCAVEHQDRNAPLVHIWRREINERNQIALHFQHGNDYYFPKVDGNNLELEKSAVDNNSENISDSHWFEKENLGNAEHYGLRTVIEPKRYLSVRFERRQCIFILSEALKECVQVTDKKIE